LPLHSAAALPTLFLRSALFLERPQIPHWPKSPGCEGLKLEGLKLLKLG